MDTFLYRIMCYVVLLVSIFDCLATVANRDCFPGCELNPIWLDFLECQPLLYLILLKLIGVGVAAFMLYIFRLWSRKWYFITPIFLLQAWLMMFLCCGCGSDGQLFSFDFQHPLEFPTLVLDRIRDLLND